MSEIRLFDLLNLSIGTSPSHQVIVNISALYALLLEVLRQLDIRDVKIPWDMECMECDSSPDASVAVSAGDEQPEEEGKEVLRDVSESDQPRSDSPRPASDSAPIMTRIGTCEDCLSEAMELMKELQKQFDHQMEKIEELQQQHKAPDSQTETLSVLEKCSHRVKALENEVISIRETLEKYTEPPKLSQQVPWDLVQSALFSENLTKETDNSAEASSVQPDPPSQVTKDPDQKAQQASSSWYQEIMVAVRTINHLQESFIQLEFQMAELDEKMDHELAQFKELIQKKGSVESDRLMAELNQQKALIENLMSDRENLDNLKDMVMNRMMEDRSHSSEEAPESLDVESSAIHELREQVVYLRKCLQKLEKDMKQLRDQQVVQKNETSDQHLQDQLDDLRGMLEASILSQTFLMSRGLQDQSETQSSEETEGSAVTSDPVKADSELSLLFQHCEQLQASVNCLTLQQNEFKTWQLEERQAVRNVGLMDVQRLVLQLQEDNEKFQETVRILQKDKRRIKENIKELYKMTEELEVKKADKPESDKEMDKSGLEKNVCQLQFDSEIQQQKLKFHELLNKVTDQQQNWQESINRLSSETEEKLNRIELDSLKIQLEKRFKNIQETLRTQESLLLGDNACLFRKQFHCLSCNRPVLMQVPGPTLNTLPSFPAFPPPKFTKPFNQVQQQDKRLTPGISCYNLGRKRAEFQRSYNDMCKQIESMESQRWEENWKSITQNPAGVQQEKTSELTDLQAVLRSARGSHTNMDANNVTQETSIIGSDGHNYNHSLTVKALKITETRPPTVPTKDGLSKTKIKAKSSASLRRAVSPEVGHTTPVHQSSHSVRGTQISCSDSSYSGHDWPVSALSCRMSQTSITSAAESDADPQSNEPVDL